MARTADWFSKLSKKAQAEYIKAHPNSKYAKGAKSKTVNAAKPTTVTARVAEAAKKHTVTANALIKKAKEKMEAAKTPATKAKWKAEVARLTAVKKALKEHGTKGKGISVSYKGGTIESVSGPAKRTSTRRKLTDIAVKTKAHETKRAADKNKAVTKTPSANAGKPHALTLTQAKVKDVKAKLANLKPGGAAHTKATAELRMLNSRLRFQRGKIKNGYAEAPVKVVKRTVSKKPAVKKPTTKKPERPNGKPSKDQAIARMTKQLRELRSQLKDVKAGSTTFKRLTGQIERLKEMRSKVKAR
jgi:hypothetical protein